MCYPKPKLKPFIGKKEIKITKREQKQISLPAGGKWVGLGPWPKNALSPRGDPKEAEKEEPKKVPKKLVQKSIYTLIKDLCETPVISATELDRLFTKLLQKITQNHPQFDEDEVEKVC